MIELDRPWIRKPDQDWSPPHPEPRGLYSDESINKSLNAMTTEAGEMGLRKGVAFIMFWPFYADSPRVTFQVVKTFERDPNPKDQNDLGTNYFGIAMQKLAYMMSTRENSGSQKRPLKNGEVGYKGGLVIITEEGSGIYAGYSGGTEEQDLQIALKGLTSYIELAETQK